MYRIEPFHEGFNTLGSVNVSRAQTKASQGCLNEAAMGRYGLSLTHLNRYHEECATQ